MRGVIDRRFHYTFLCAIAQSRGGFPGTYVKPQILGELSRLVDVVVGSVGDRLVHAGGINTHFFDFIGFYCWNQ